MATPSGREDRILFNLKGRTRVWIPHDTRFSSVVEVFYSLHSFEKSFRRLSRGARIAAEVGNVAAGDYFSHPSSQQANGSFPPSASDGA